MHYHFRWTDELEQHIALHGVTTAEFEEVVANPDGVDISRSSGALIAFGMTSTGKYLACVYDEFAGTIYPATAYEVEE